MDQGVDYSSVQTGYLFIFSILNLVVHIINGDGCCKITIHKNSDHEHSTDPEQHDAPVTDSTALISSSSKSQEQLNVANPIDKDSESCCTYNAHFCGAPCTWGLFRSLVVLLIAILITGSNFSSPYIDAIGSIVVALTLLQFNVDYFHEQCQDSRNNVLANSF